MRYCVTVVRTGCVFVEAETETDAIDIADHQTTDTVSWSADWTPTECVEDDSGRWYVTERAFD